MTALTRDFTDLAPDPLTASALLVRGPVATTGDADDRAPLVRARSFKHAVLKPPKRLRSHTPPRAPTAPFGDWSNRTAIMLVDIKLSDYDVRPRLLRLAWMQCFEELPAILKHFEACLAIWCMRTGRAASADARTAAVCAAVDHVYRSRDAIAVNKMARAVGMRASAFLQLRQIAFAMVEARFAEAQLACWRIFTGSEYDRETLKCRYRRRVQSETRRAWASPARPRSSGQDIRPASGM